MVKVKRVGNFGLDGLIVGSGVTLASGRGIGARLARMVCALAGVVVVGVVSPTGVAEGQVWTSRTLAADNTGRSVAFGNGVGVAVASGGARSGGTLAATSGNIDITAGAARSTW